MATEATTIHSALMASPRRNATTPKAQAPTIASTTQGMCRRTLLLLFMKDSKKWTDKLPRKLSPSTAIGYPTLV
ncbi:hypothetical protein D9M68_523440 [compost metagenome]